MASRPSLPPSVVTGASGFVGRALLARIPEAAALALGGLDWRERIGRAAFDDAVIFHLAARVHGAGGEDEFERDNVVKSVALAEAAAAGGARRLVFLSSIKVNGEETSGRAFSVDDRADPRDAYGRSKSRAETALGEVTGRTGLALAIVRSPLVVGAGARGNLDTLMRLCDGPWPLPFASIRNRRTLVDVDDLARLLILCGCEPHAAGRLFLAGDPEPVSTPGLVAMLRAGWKRPPRLIPCPVALLETGARVAGQGARMRSLTRSLEVDVSGTVRDLAWKPARPLADSIAAMARAHRAGARA